MYECVYYVVRYTYIHTFKRKATIGVRYLALCGRDTIYYIYTREQGTTRLNYVD